MRKISNYLHFWLKIIIFLTLENELKYFWIFNGLRAKTRRRKGFDFQWLARKDAEAQKVDFQWLARKDAEAQRAGFGKLLILLKKKLYNSYIFNNQRTLRPSV